MNAATADAAERAALLVQHAVAPAARGRYEAWLAEVTRECRRFDGFQGVAVLRPARQKDGYTVIVHFDTHAQLQAWISSAQRRRLVAALPPLLEQAERLRTGMELWFTPDLSPGRQARPYKQFLLTFSAIYPLSLLVPAGLRLLIQDLDPPTGLVQLAGTALIVWLMVYVVMPRYVRAVASWLFR